MTTTILGLDPAQIERQKAVATAREIAQQPRLWRETAAGIAARRAEIAAFLDPLLARPELRVVLTGAGTSAFAGEILAPDLSAALGRRVEAIATTDIVARPADAFAGGRPVLLVSFARSGNSPESVAATELADQCLGEVHHLIVTCNGEGELFRRHQGAAGSLVLLMPDGSNDEGFAMTSSVTSMMLAAALALTGATAPSDLAEPLALAAESVLGTRAPEIGALAARRFERIVYLGSGAFKGLAREAALKVMELTAGEALAYADTPLGFRHGPKALLNERCVAFVFVANDPHARAYDRDILAELAGQLGGGQVVAIGAEAAGSGTGAWTLPALAGLPDWQAALPLLVHAQLFALQASLALGKSVDNPFPSGEVNRVVQGVTIHPYAG
ncbi:putative tagatose-6-phosphate ketose/aldose isomerase [Aureimonas endophytica]|uniref:Tagatose-6-phosphate ketose/aldose isomerase n=1 Tax=Aureimonas endophytica TaxID=2027858 RepID=A0A917EDE9_9HYPH|nr:SIS domain-containing protein [Aureimonas endophytica]GGE22608.1 putative tagatose-6-phosphate ketose/aldose isomerase [Aureimonas endophytica]